MRFIHLDLGFRRRGELVEITLSAPANAWLLDASNLQKYRTGTPHEGMGGALGTDPVRLRIPYAGSWHVAVDQDGSVPDVKTTLRILQPQPLPALDVPLGRVLRVRHPLPEVAGPDLCDVFIAHVAEDRGDVVKPLTEALRGEGLAVSTDRFELKRGEDPRRTVEEGIACSRFGILVVSTHLFAMKYPRRQLDELTLRRAGHVQVMLPLWHHVPKLEVDEHSHLMALAVARETGSRTFPQIAAEVAAFLSEGVSSGEPAPVP